MWRGRSNQTAQFGLACGGGLSLDFVNNETTPLSIREAFSGKHLLVTGVTGFVAKVWVTLLLTHLPEVGRLTVLVRGRRRQSAEARLREIVETSPALRPLRERHGDALSWG